MKATLTKPENFEFNTSIDLTTQSASATPESRFATKKQNVLKGYSITSMSPFGQIFQFPKRSSALSLIKYAGKWKGRDLDKQLKDVYSSRSKTEF